MRKNIKDELRRAYEEETPNMREEVMRACEGQVQERVPAPQPKRKGAVIFWRRFAAVACSIVLFAVGLFVGKIIPTTPPATAVETSVYLDVNPSIEMTLDKDNRVLTCVPATLDGLLDEDAKKVLGEMDLTGVELKTALNAIVGSMYVNGYLNAENNSMLVSVDTKDSENTTPLLDYITAHVNGALGATMQCSIIAQGVEVNEGLKERAREQGVSVGKMHLVDKVVQGIEDLKDTDVPRLTDMSIGELNLLYTSRPHRPDEPKNDEMISGENGAFLEKDVALQAVLTLLQVDETAVDFYSVFAIPSFEGNRRLVYAVTIKLQGEDTPRKFEVDCKTGEAVEKTQAGGQTPPPEQPPQDGGQTPPFEQPPQGEGQNPPQGETHPPQN